MAKLPKLTLGHNEKKNIWILTNDKTDRVIRRFDTKGEATKGGVLKKILGDSGGSVKIKKLGGKFQEERTFPPSADPEESKG